MIVRGPSPVRKRVEIDDAAAMITKDLLLLLCLFCVKRGIAVVLLYREGACQKDRLAVLILLTVRYCRREGGEGSGGYGEKRSVTCCALWIDSTCSICQPLKETTMGVEGMNERRNSFNISLRNASELLPSTRGRIYGAGESGKGPNFSLFY